MFNNLGDRISTLVTKWVGTWTFIFLYTLTMAIWMALHISDVLNIDSQDFIKWNLWLSYFAGIQASIVLMSTERQARIDREKQEESLDELGEQLELVSTLVEEYVDDHEQKNKKGDKSGK